MSINQYKQYKNNKITELDIKLQNIGLDRVEIKYNAITYLIKNKKYIILLIMFSGYLGSEFYLNNNGWESIKDINAFKYNTDSCIDLFNSFNKGIGSI
jgi:hypothetical protein